MERNGETSFLKVLAASVRARIKAAASLSSAFSAASGASSRALKRMKVGLMIVVLSRRYCILAARGVPIPIGLEFAKGCSCLLVEPLQVVCSD